MLFGEIQRGVLVFYNKGYAYRTAYKIIRAIGFLPIRPRLIVRPVRGLKPQPLQHIARELLINRVSFIIAAQRPGNCYIFLIITRSAINDNLNFINDLSLA
jgi:hypothetical protein